MEFVRGQGQHVDVLFLHVHMDMSDGLHRVRVEGDLLLPAERADFRDGLDRADLVVGEHHRHKAGVLPDGVPDGLHGHDAVFGDLHIGHVPAFFLQLFQRVEHGVMLEGGGDDVLPVLSRSVLRRGDDRHIVRFGTSGGKGDLARLAAQHRGGSLAGVLEHFLCPLTHGMEGGRIAPGLLHHPDHGLDGCLAGFRRGGVVGVYVHHTVPFFQPIVPVGLYHRCPAVSMGLLRFAA